MSATESSLVQLSDGIRAYFALPWVLKDLSAHALDAPNVTPTGWKQREQILNQGKGQANRVLLMPGNDKGDEGDFEQPRHRKVNPRVLWTWNRIVTASVWAVDKADKDDEQLQISATDRLANSFVQALHLFAKADYKLLRAYRTVRSHNLPFGYERLIEFIYRTEVNELPEPVVTGVTPVIDRNPPS